VILKGDGATAPSRRSDRDILVEGRRSLNRRLLDALVLPDRVGRSIARECALHGALLRRVRRILYDVVFNEGVSSPSVDGEKAYSARDGESTIQINRAGNKYYQSRTDTRINSVHYVVVPVCHPLPTTKSWVVSKVTEKEFPFGEKLTEPPVV